MDYVLVIDDEPSVRRMASFMLRTAGYEVYEAEDGGQALELCKWKQPMAIVLDLQMPGIDGRSFFQSIDGPDRPPVIIVSAYGAERARAELGADACLGKPFDPVELTAIVRELSA